MTFHDKGFIEGSKKSSSKGGSSSSASTGGVQAPNTLRSSQLVNLVELLGEGEIEGVVGGGQGIYFDQTPAINADGTWNKVIQVIDYRNGLPDQSCMDGFASAETPISVNADVKASQGPIIRTITEEGVTSVRIVTTIPSLVYQDTKTGNTYGTSTSWGVDVRTAGGPWVNKINRVISNQKCTSAYRTSDTFDLTDVGPGPWDIRYTRTTPDSTVDNLQNSTTWESFTLVKAGQFAYPDCALVGIKVDAAQFGNSLPARAFRVRGLKTMVPSNYDPVAKTYSGIWDGSFVKKWHSNPAWVLYDLLTNNRYGLGEFITATNVDKWSLYQIAQYCDQRVPTGNKDANGVDVMEPRFSFNGVINSREEAFKVLSSITSRFRGMAYWSLGQVYASADMPEDPIAEGGLLSPADVIDGHFTYSGTAMKARHSVALVSWNDPDDFYQTAVEVVQDDAALQKFGWRETEVQLQGCTSRTEAHRHGRWLLDSEQNETELVEFSCSWEQAKLLPGKIILIADPRKAGGIRTGGRLAGVAGTRVQLDAPFIPAGSVYTLYAVLPDGSVVGRTVDHFEVGDAGNGYEIAVLTSAFPVDPLLNAMWVMSGADVTPRRYRVMSVNETDKHIFKVTALFNDPTKYARIEYGIKLDPIQYTRPKKQIAAPTNLKLSENTYFQNGMAHSRLNVGWTPGADFLSSTFNVCADTPQGFVSFGDMPVPYLEIQDPAPGAWTVYVTAYSIAGTPSQPTIGTYTVKGWDGAAGPSVTGLSVQGGGFVFSGRDCTVVWDHTFPDGVTPYAPANVVRIYDYVTGAVVHQERVPAGSNRFTYSIGDNTNDGGPRRKFKVGVGAITVAGAETGNAIVVVENPAPSAIDPDVRSTPAVGTGTGDVFVTIPPVADTDVQGALVHASQNGAFVPSASTLQLDTKNTTVSFPLAQGTWFVKVALYDDFDKTTLNYSTAKQVVVAPFSGWEATPAIPTWPANGITSTVDTLSDGTFATTLKLDWNDNADAALFGNYELQLRETVSGVVGNWVTVYDGSTSYYEEKRLRPGAVIDARVRAISKLAKTASGYSAVQSAIVAKKTTGPSAISGLVANAAFSQVFLSWTNPTDPDLDLIEVWAATSNDLTNAIRIGTTAGSAFTHGGLATGATWYYWVRPTNTSYPSAPAGSFFPVSTTGGVSAKTASVNAADLAFDLQPAVTKVTSLPTSYVTDYVSFNGALYQWKGSSYALAIDAGNLTGYVKVNQLAVGDFTNLISNGSLTQNGSPSTTGWTLTSGTGLDVLTSDAVRPYRLLCSDGANFPAIWGTQIPVSPGQVFAVGVDVYNTRTTPNAGLFINFLAPDGTTVVNQFGGKGNLFTGIKNAWVRIDDQVTVPAGASRAVFYTFADAGPGDVYFANMTMRRAQTANMIVDGSLVAGKLAADSVVAANIVGGAISARELGIGLSGNMLENSDFSAGSAHFGYNPGNISGLTYARSEAGASVYFPAGFGGGAIYSSSTPSGSSYTYADLVYGANKPAGSVFLYYEEGACFPCIPNQRYELSASLSVHRCKAVLYILWLDASRNYIGESTVTLASNYANNLKIDTSPRGQVFGTAPSNAVYMSVMVRMVGTGEANPFIYATAWYLGKASPSQTTFTPYQPAGGTYVDGVQVITRSITAAQIAVGTLTADLIQAGTITGDRLNVNTSLPATITLGATGVKVGDAATWANDPAARINANSTVIGAGKLDIFGNTILSNWKYGGDNTSINGGAIAANTITANKLQVGLRGVTTVGLDFSADKSTRTISWSQGYILYKDDSGVPQYALVSGGSYASNGIFSYVYWDKTSPASLYAGTNNWDAIFNNPNCILLCSYDGFAGLNPFMGGTVIDGTRINTGTITANQLQTHDLITYTAQIADAIITDAKITALTASKITAGQISASTYIDIGSDHFRLNGADKSLTLTNTSNGVQNVRMDLNGITIRDNQNRIVLSSGSGVNAATIAGLSAGRNLVPNSDFMGGNYNVGITPNDGSYTAISLGTNYAENVWNPPGMQSATIVVNPNSGSTFADCYIYNSDYRGQTNKYPVVANQEYEFSLYASAHRCTAAGIVTFYDVSQNIISNVFTTSVASNYCSGALVNWNRLTARAVAPSNAAFATLTVRASQHQTGGQNYVFFTGVYLGQMIPGQPDYSPWSKSNGMIQITSGNVSTYIASAAIGTAYIGDAAITNAKIGNLQVDTIKIANGSLSTLSGFAGYVPGGGNAASWDVYHRGGPAVLTVSFTNLDTNSRYNQPTNGGQAVNRGYRVYRGTSGDYGTQILSLNVDDKCVFAGSAQATYTQDNLTAGYYSPATPGGVVRYWFFNDSAYTMYCTFTISEQLK